MSAVIPLRDKMIPWYFVIFFIVIALVDGTMVTLAIRTHTGTITEHPYEKGLAYNRVVEAESKQAALGWQSEIRYRKEGLFFSLKDRNGQEIIPDHLTAFFSRPTQSGMDFSVELKGQTTAVTFPMAGLWEVQIEALYQDKSYQRTERIVVE